MRGRRAQRTLPAFILLMVLITELLAAGKGRPRTFALRNRLASVLPLNISLFGHDVR